MNHPIILEVQLFISAFRFPRGTRLDTSGMTSRGISGPQECGSCSGIGVKVRPLIAALVARFPAAQESPVGSHLPFLDSTGFD